MSIKANIVGWGKYLPARVLTNDDLAQMVDTSHDWIVNRTGIHQRRIAADHESVSTMAIAAGCQALERADMSASELDMIIVGTSTADDFLPPAASRVQAGLGAGRAAAMDVNAACSGFVFALATAYQFIGAGTCQRVLVIGSDINSRILDWSDRTTCVLFGDGAGAVVLEAADNGGPLSLVLGNDGDEADLLYAPSLCAPRAGSNRGTRPYMTMTNGPELFRHAVQVMTETTRRALDAACLTTNDLSLMIAHQANGRIISAVARALDLPPHKAYSNIDRYGNTSAASVPIALSEAADDGLLKPGDRVALVGLGAGLTWGVIVLPWNPQRSRVATGE